MDYAVVAHKNFGANWGEFQAKRRKAKKGTKKALKTKKVVDPIDKILGVFKSITKNLFRIVILAAFFYSLYSGYVFLTQSPYFAVSKAVFSGNQKLTAEELKESIGHVSGQNIFLLDLEGLSRGLVEHPWVRSVSVKRVFPNSVQVDLVERIPYARIQLDQVYVMDNFGVLLAKEEPAYKHLPLIARPVFGEVKLGANVAGSGVTQSLQAMHFLNNLSLFQKNPIIAAQTQSGNRVEFYTRDKNFKIVMDMDHLQESFQNFLIVANEIEKEISKIASIDLSFKDKVVTRYKKEAI